MTSKGPDNGSPNFVSSQSVSFKKGEEPGGIGLNDFDDISGGISLAVAHFLVENPEPLSRSITTRLLKADIASIGFIDVRFAGHDLEEKIEHRDPDVPRALVEQRGDEDRDDMRGSLEQLSLKHDRSSGRERARSSGVAPIEASCDTSRNRVARHTG